MRRKHFPFPPWRSWRLGVHSSEFAELAPTVGVSPVIKGYRMMKYLAVLSAVALVGGYIYLKFGSGRPIPLSRISHDLAKDVTLMPGSKSSAPFTPNDKLDTERPMMSGSKSLAPLITSRDVRSEIAEASATQPTTSPTK
jgi:hypothetical protein